MGFSVYCFEDVAFTMLVQISVQLMLNSFDVYICPLPAEPPPLHPLSILALQVLSLGMLRSRRTSGSFCLPFIYVYSLLTRK